MPTSYLENIPEIIKLAQSVKPESVMDCGIGCGKYGLLCREYIQPKELRAIEAWSPYLKDYPWLTEIYDSVYVGDLRTAPLPQMDLYLLVDVIEHFSKEDGNVLLKKMKAAAKHVLISTPKLEYYAHYTNPFEDHKSHWTLADFTEFTFEDHSNDLSTIVLLK